jgi:hypothetical protein
MVERETPDGAMEEVSALLTAVDEHDRALGEQFRHDQTGEPAPASDIDQAGTRLRLAERDRERGGMFGCLLDRPGAEETEALRFAQHLDRLGSHLTPG